MAKTLHLKTLGSNGEFTVPDGATDIDIQERQHGLVLTYWTEAEKATPALAESGLELRSRYIGGAWSPWRPTKREPRRASLLEEYDSVTVSVYGWEHEYREAVR